MQNLTARYNYIYNANIRLEDYVSTLYGSFQDNYNELLPVHLSPQKFNPANLSVSSDEKALEDIITKSRTIITDKSLSNYLDDAYLLMGKSEFYKGNFFLAAEYFGYVVKTYSENQLSLIDALDWQARTQIQLNDLKLAATAVDSLQKHLEGLKKHPAEPVATLAQMSIALGQTKAAIPYLEAAIRESKRKRNTIRWHYILGQLYQQAQDYAPAAEHYRKVQSSNAGFDLYFNARLNLLEVDALRSGNPSGTEEQLLSLLKDEKNQEFSDQIYYKIAQYHQAQRSYAPAIAYYNKAIAAATTNKTLIGMANLQLAELSVSQQRAYLQAKRYYDLALSSLPKNYPGYDLILKKSQNLSYLASRQELIETEDSLQMLAALPEANREIRARQILFPVLTDTATTASAAPASIAAAPPKNGTFYFQNQVAMERGYADFIRRWGNRKLEPNWRQSIRNNASNTQQTLSLDPVTLQQHDGLVPQNTSDSIKLANYLASIPVNSQMLRASNERIVNAYVELASFYEQELKASEEAAAIYERLLEQYPDNSQLAAINYSLYLIYKDVDKEKAERYKQALVNNHASSIYARIILDPDYRIDQNVRELELSNNYNTLFERYLKGDFTGVIALADQQLISSPQSKLAPQLAYLKGIAIGRTKPVDQLIQAFQAIQTTYAGDSLIVPLVNDHLNYINAHLAEFKRRRIALVDFDPNEPRFIAQRSANVQQSTTNPSANNLATHPAVSSNTPQHAKQTVIDPAVSKTSQGANMPFSKAASSTWYFVVDVEDASIRLSTSRFGIGQFTRGNYPESDLRHQLVEFDNDQLIYVGNFSNFEAAKAFQDRIAPQMNRIMRIRPTLFNTFIISKENFDIIKSKSLLNQYLEFYKNTY